MNSRSFRRKTSFLYNFIDGAVVALCLPFYAVVWPIFALSQRALLKKIGVLDCPHCGSSLAQVPKDGLESVMKLISWREGTVVDWSRSPSIGFTVRPAPWPFVSTDATESLRAIPKMRQFVDIMNAQVAVMPPKISSVPLAPVGAPIIPSCRRRPSFC